MHFAHLVEYGCRILVNNSFGPVLSLCWSTVSYLFLGQHSWSFWKPRHLVPWQDHCSRILRWPFCRYWIKCWSSCMTPYLHSAESPIFHCTRFFFIFATSTRRRFWVIRGSYLRLRPGIDPLLFLSMFIDRFYIFRSTFECILEVSVIKVLVVLYWKLCLDFNLLLLDVYPHRGCFSSELHFFSSFVITCRIVTVGDMPLTTYSLLVIINLWLFCRFH